MTVDADAALVGRLLARRWGDTVRVGAGRLIKDWNRHRVVRWLLFDAPAPAAISKTSLRETERIFGEWSALLHIGAGAAAGDAPRFLAGDEGGATIVMEDLGEGRSLEDLLRSEDRHAAERALLESAVLLGRLHAANADSGIAFSALRSRLPGPPTPSLHEQVQRYLLRVEALGRWFRGLGVAEPPGWTAAVTRAAQEALLCEPFRCLTHGDWAPANVHVAGDGRVRLLDWEYAAYRHPLYDALCWHLVCPMPEILAARMDAAYRGMLVRALPELEDDRRWERQRALVGAFRGLDVLSWLPAQALRRDGSWIGEWTVRQAFGCVAARAFALCARDDGMAPIATGLERLLEAHDRRCRSGRARLPPWAALEA